jgi:DNA replication protein DnaC
MNEIDTASLRLSELLRSFKLPTASAEIVARVVDGGHEEALPLLAEIFELEHQDRWQRRVERRLRASKLAPGKRFETFDDTRLPRPLARTMRELENGAFLEEATNVLAFGLPGTGKSHFACALGHRLVENGHSVLFVPTYKLVQDLLAAKRDLELPRALRKLDNFELLVLDDIGYVQQGASEVEVLFTLMAERYERRSILITSNLVFSEWDRIFNNPMTTAAAIDRLVHHSVILEFDVTSYRTKNMSKASEPTNKEVTS